MTLAEAREALQAAEALRHRAELVLADPNVLTPCKALWEESHLEAIRALEQIRRVLEGRT